MPAEKVSHDVGLNLSSTKCGQASGRILGVVKRRVAAPVLEGRSEDFAVLLVETVPANLKIVLRFIFVIQGMETLGGARVDCDEKSTADGFWALRSASGHRHDQRQRLPARILDRLTERS